MLKKITVSLLIRSAVLFLVLGGLSSFVSDLLSGYLSDHVYAPILERSRLPEFVTISAALSFLALIRSFLKKDQPARDRALIKYVEIAAVLIATVGGISALGTYKSTNVISVRSSLETRDSQIREIYFSKEGELLMNLFTEPPGEVADEVSCKLAQDKIEPWARSAILAVVKSTNLASVPTLPKIEILAHSMFDLSTSSSPGMTDIKRGLFHAIDILYIVFDAFSAKEMGVIDKKEYQMWAGYIDELGSNPYFLMAILDGHEYGYTTKAFSREIWRHFSKKKNPRLHCFAHKLYPKLATANEEEWMKSWGKERYKRPQYSIALNRWRQTVE